MACDQTGHRTDGHTGKEGGAEQQDGAEHPSLDSPPAWSSYRDADAAGTVA